MSQTATQNQYHTTPLNTNLIELSNTSHFNPFRVQNAHSGFASEHFFRAVLNNPCQPPPKLSRGQILLARLTSPITLWSSRNPLSTHLQRTLFLLNVNRRRHLSPLFCCRVKSPVFYLISCVRKSETGMLNVGVN